MHFVVGGRGKRQKLSTNCTLYCTNKVFSLYKQNIVIVINYVFPTESQSTGT